MSKIICEKCHEAYSSDTNKCPGCGAMANTEKKVSVKLLVMVIVADFMALVGVLAALYAAGILKF